MLFLRIFLNIFSYWKLLSYFLETPILLLARIYIKLRHNALLMIFDLLMTF